jgi:RNA polymerase sigma-70 factor (ECF subfamily)
MLLTRTLSHAPRSADAELVIRARAGDAAAQEELARLHRRSAYFLALQLLGNREDAMDVTQDAMLRLFATLHRFDVRRPLRPWLYQIVRNRVVDLMRRRRIRCHDSLDTADEEGNRRFEPVDLSVDLDRDVDRARLRRGIWRTLEALPHKQREILVLRDYQDLSYAEIAETLGIPIGTVMSRLHGARKRLREALQEQESATGRSSP